MTETCGPILIVSGMHRSGTSLLASMLMEAGLDLGSRFNPADIGNVRGYYENTDFLNLHAQFLEQQGLSRYGWTLERNVRIPAPLREQAENAVRTNARSQPWGWKDPRTVLFLDFWAEMLPQANFLFAFRSPWEVVDSLFRRGDQAFQDDPVLAVRIWEHYNRLVLEFCRAHPQRCLLVGVEVVKRDFPALLDLINQRFAMSLSVPNSELFDQSLLRQDGESTQRPSVINAYFPSAYQLWQELIGRADLSRQERELSDHLAEPDNCQLSKITLDDWMELRKTQRERAELEKTLEKRLYDVRSDLYHAGERIKFIERSRIWKLRNQLAGLRKLFQRGQGEPSAARRP